MRIVTIALWLLVSTTPALAGDYADPQGDNSRDEDISSIRGQYDADNLLLRLDFYPGSSDPFVSGASFGIDTDMNPSTGSQAVFPFGAEYSVSYNPLHNIFGARLFQHDAQGGAEIGVVDAIPTGSGIRVTIPRSIIGGAGLVNYGVVAGPAVDDSIILESDYAPDDVLINGMTATSVVICEPDLAPPQGVLDFNDVVAFLTSFSSMEMDADFAEPQGVFDFNDVVAFLTLFAAGCP